MDVAHQYLVKIIGADGIAIIEQLPSGEIVDEVVAADTNIDINAIRKTLFKLYENRLANYRREREPDTGWLTYHWMIHLENINSRLDIEVEKLLNNLRDRLEFEMNNVFYTCKNNCTRFLFETAAETDFICPVCADELFYQDNSEMVDKLSYRVLELESATQE
jgi:transcription initiation factor TFIIE subunit alpha